jgi:hypothetical protein
VFAFSTEEDVAVKISASFLIENPSKSLVSAEIIGCGKWIQKCPNIALKFEMAAF